MEFILKKLLPSALLVVSASVVAQDFPRKPIHLVVGYSPGGASDIVARLLAEELSADLGQPVIVENKPGAGGNIGAAQVAKMPADGYSLFLGDTGTLVLSKAIYKKLNYDPDKDLAPISTVADSGLFLVVNKSFPAGDMKELMDYAKARPGTLSYASPGNGSVHHVAMERLKTKTGLEIAHIPYRGSNQATVDLIAGHVPMMLLNPATTISSVRGGGIRALATLTLERSPELPDVPTTRELGIDGVEAMNLWTLMAPAGTPQDAIGVLAASVEKAVKNPQFANKVKELGMTAMSSTPAELAERLAEDNATLRTYVRSMNLNMDE